MRIGLWVGWDCIFDNIIFGVDIYIGYIMYGVADHISNTCSCNWEFLNALDSDTQKSLPQIQPFHLNVQLLNLLLQFSEYQTQLH